MFSFLLAGLLSSLWTVERFTPAVSGQIFNSRFTD